MSPGVGTGLMRSIKMEPRRLLQENFILTFMADRFVCGCRAADLKYHFESALPVSWKVQYSKYHSFISFSTVQTFK